MTASQSIFQHFRPEEQVFIEKVQDLVRQVEEQYVLRVTEFLNPREVAIVENIAASTGLACFISSQYWQTEYAKVIIAPDYYVLDADDFDIVLLECRYNSKFNQLSHRQIMGTLINQLGIQRHVFGDILLTEGRAQILVDRSMADYFEQNITKMGRVPVSWRRPGWSDLLPQQEQSQVTEILSKSLRADAIISEVLKVSRNVASNLIEKDKVKLNYASLSRSSQELTIGDLLSIRGYGRFRLADDKGFSKSGKHKLTIKKITQH